MVQRIGNEPRQDTHFPSAGSFGGKIFTNASEHCVNHLTYENPIFDYLLEPI
jgi:hypothetical protein